MSQKSNLFRLPASVLIGRQAQRVQPFLVILAEL